MVATIELNYLCPVTIVRGTKLLRNGFDSMGGEIGISPSIETGRKKKFGEQKLSHSKCEVGKSFLQKQTSNNSSIRV